MRDDTGHCTYCGEYIVPGICDPERKFEAHTAERCRDALVRQLGSARIDALKEAIAIVNECLMSGENKAYQLRSAIERRIETIAIEARRT